MFVDSHVHSAFSPDSKMRMQDACDMALKRGLAGLVFTDHVDLPSQKWIFDPVARAASVKTVLELCPPAFTVLQGVELGFQPHAIELSASFLQSYPFDFVLLSVHNVDGINLAAPSCYTGKSVEQTCRRYLEEIYASVEQFDDFDVVGHIGYVLRYLPRGHAFESFPCCCQLLDKLFMRIIEKGKGIEVNASGYRYGLENPSPSEYFVRRYRELGGTIITMGSDAHAPGAVGNPFEKVAALLRSAGFLHVTYFNKREAVWVPLS